MAAADWRCRCINHVEITRICALLQEEDRHVASIAEPGCTFCSAPTAQIARIYRGGGAVAGDWDWREHGDFLEHGCGGAASSGGAAAGPRDDGGRAAERRRCQAGNSGRLPGLEPREPLIWADGGVQRAHHEPDRGGRCLARGCVAHHAELLRCVSNSGADGACVYRR